MSRLTEMAHLTHASLWRLGLGSIVGMVLLAAAGSVIANPAPTPTSPAQHASQQAFSPCPYQEGAFCAGPSGSWSS